MLRYSPRALPALLTLFRRFNDINVFVEDDKYTNMYSIYLQRILGDKAKIKKIFSLSGKDNVIAKAKDDTFAQSYSPCLFLIDGDFDLHCGRPSPRVKKLHRLNVYCAENLLCCGKAALELCFESSPDDTRETIEKKIDFEAWKTSFEAAFAPLFIEYAVAHFCNTQDIQTSSYHVMRILQGKDLSSSDVKARISTRIQEVRQEIINQVGQDKYDAAKQKIETSIQKKTPSHLISGKTYLLPALYHHLKKTTQYRDVEGAFRTRLAKYADLTIDKSLIKAVMKAAA